MYTPRYTAAELLYHNTTGPEGNFFDGQYVQSPAELNALVEEADYEFEDARSLDQLIDELPRLLDARTQELTALFYDPADQTVFELMVETDFDPETRSLLEKQRFEQALEHGQAVVNRLYSNGLGSAEANELGMEAAQALHDHLLRSPLESAQLAARAQAENEFNLAFAARLPASDVYNQPTIPNIQTRGTADPNNPWIRINLNPKYSSEQAAVAHLEVNDATGGISPILTLESRQFLDRGHLQRAFVDEICGISVDQISQELTAALVNALAELKANQWQTSAAACHEKDACVAVAIAKAGAAHYRDWSKSKALNMVYRSLVKD